jgi:hypothetical protein
MFIQPLNSLSDILPGHPKQNGRLLIPPMYNLLHRYYWAQTKGTKSVLVEIMSVLLQSYRPCMHTEGTWREWRYTGPHIPNLCNWLDSGHVSCSRCFTRGEDPHTIQLHIELATGWVPVPTWHFGTGQHILLLPKMVPKFLKVLGSPTQFHFVSLLVHYNHHMTLDWIL